MRLAFVILLVLTPSMRAQTTPDIGDLLSRHQFDLGMDGRGFLLDEARKAAFVLVGGLHGENETQALVQALLPALDPGPALVLSEMSPWAATRLFGTIPDDAGVQLRGADVEAAQLMQLVVETAALTPEHPAARQMVMLVEGGYTRARAAELLSLARQLPDGHAAAGGIPLPILLVRSLEVEADRSRPGTSGLTASSRRERAMKDFTLAHYRQATSGAKAKPRVLLSFGRNHMHRGVDRRGVSTLGNFVSELAAAEGGESFHVALFAAGGRINLGGVRDADERKDDPAFEYLAALARFPETVFDLRPLREPLRTLPGAARAPAQSSLLYWADSYDAMVCYREITPVGSRP